MCFNINIKTVGSFAALYHRKMFKFALKWMENEKRPFDHIHPFLSEKG